MWATTLQQLFETQVAATPDQVAVDFEDRTLTYRELNLRANNLAKELIDLGVGPEVLVGVYFLRCPELMIALLGVLKAGGAFLPLDPECPERRLSFMLEDAATRFLLTHPPLQDRLPPHECKVITVAHESPSRESSLNPACQTGPDSMAYLMYTSGSTGRPKGILIPQRGLVNYLLWSREAYPLAAGRGAPVHSSIAFDLTITSLFTPLIAGRTVHLLPQGNAIDLLRAAFRSAEPFSLIKLTPAHLELLGQVLEPQDAAGRTQAFIIGGENLTARQIKFWQDFAPNTLLINEYGPTETVVGCCVYTVPPGPPVRGSVPIGKAIAETQLYILDRELHPVPPGQEGELYIGGAGVARGYHNRPDLTAERFLPDPFSTQPGARFYRSGDRVRILPDGNLEFLGRTDSQVKILGFRIETDEVEGALEEHPGVKRAVVVAREDIPGEKRLVAYLLTQPQQTVTRTELRNYLRGRLQHYMIPTDLVFLETLPLTLNGKVDRAALPSPDRSRLKPGTPCEPFQTTEQARMLGLWEEVLETRPIGIRDNFFELGGESLHAVRLFTRIRKTFGRDLPLASLLEAPTVEQLVRLLDEPETDRVVSLIPLRTGGTSPPLFLICGAGGDVLSLRELAGLLDPDRPVYGLQTRRQENTSTYPTTLEELAARHRELIVSAQPQGPYFLSGYSFGGNLAFEIAQQLQASGQEIAFLAILDQRAYASAVANKFRSSWIKIFTSIPRWAYQDLSRLRPFYVLSRFHLWLHIKIPGLGKLLKSKTRWSVTPELDTDTSLGTAAHTSLIQYHMRLQASYVPKSYSGALTLLQAEDQQIRKLMDRLLAGNDLGWGRLVKERLRVIILAGNHHSILKKPHVAILAAHLRRILDESSSAVVEKLPLTTQRAQTDFKRSPEQFAEFEEIDGASWRVVVNHEGQYSIWPNGRALPNGWLDAGIEGSRRVCLASIAAMWNDLRPLSVRREPFDDGSLGIPTEGLLAVAQGSA